MISQEKDIHLEIEDIQGIIISGYKRLFFSSYLFLRIDDGSKAQEWLKQIVPQVTNSSQHPRELDSAINIAFTYKGLEKLNKLPPKTLKTFSQEFREGMDDQDRSRQLGDLGANAPEHWEEPWRRKTESSQEEIHILLLLQAVDKEKLHTLRKAQEGLFEPWGVSPVVVEEGRIPYDSKEHFGFQDSISQPEIAGSPKQKGGDCIKPGEFILGYQNEDGNFPLTPIVDAAQDENNNLQLLENKGANKPQLKDFGRNGSYLVFRKLHQHVAKFRQYFRDNFSDPQQQELMAAKVVGRWRSGAPLVLAPDYDPNDSKITDNNSFSYRETDIHGYKCPLGAHIRRVNPRDALEQDPHNSLKSVNRRRLLRRGVIYGEPLPDDAFEDDQQPRGVLFFCINADIRRQFEFVQQTWVNNSQFSGLYDERDPLIGCPYSGNSTQQMTIQQEPVRQRLTDLPNFVSVKGGAYFFLPSISALYFLAGARGVDRHK